MCLDGVVFQDKGIHDGRRSDKDQFNEIADGRSADPSARVSKHLAKDLPPTFSAMSPCGMPTTIRAIPQSADAVTDVIPHATQEVAVQLRIAEGHTSDGIIKDVEFLFHIGQDNFDVRSRFQFCQKCNCDVFSSGCGGRNEARAQPDPSN